MSYNNPGLVLYLRPSAAIQPYRISECAQWLVELGRFKTYRNARLYLNYIGENDRNQFRYIMSLYFDNNIYRYKPIYNNVNTYHADMDIERYGEQHMYY